MHNIRLTREDGSYTIVEANKTSLNFLWKNYYRLGFVEIEDLTLMRVNERNY